jgi:probable phosphoglycerate mutase
VTQQALDPLAVPRPPIPEGLDATLVLLRHGESEYIREGRFQGQAETPLSDTGRRQAALAAERLAHPHRSPALPVPAGPLLEIVHSPLARVAETAGAVAAAVADAAGSGPGRDGAPGASSTVLRPDPGFLEIAQGEWEGETHAEILRRWPDELAAWRRRPHEVWAPGGESIAEVRARVQPALARILDRLGEGRPAGSPDRPQVGGYAGVDPAAGQPWSIVAAHDGVFKVTMLTLLGLPLSHFWSFTFALCGITVVELRAGRAVLRAHGLTAHLGPLEDAAAEAQQEQRARSGAL